MAQASDQISSADAATICGVDRATFNRWAAKGLVPIELTTPSGSRVFSRKVIEEWAEQQPRKVSVA
jgi:DNA-binding transcriptional MerR regulator